MVGFKAFDANCVETKLKLGTCECGAAARAYCQRRTFYRLLSPATCSCMVRPFSWVNSEILIVAVLTRCRDKEGRVNFISVKQHYSTNTA